VLCGLFLLAGALPGHAVDLDLMDRSCKDVCMNDPNVNSKDVCAKGCEAAVQAAKRHMKENWWVWLTDDPSKMSSSTHLYYPLIKRDCENACIRWKPKYRGSCYIACKAAYDWMDERNGYRFFK
jgi:hypothetical protein